MNNYQPVPTLETERLILRAIKLGDIPSYKRHFINYEVISQLAAAVPWPYPDDGVQEFLTKVIFPQQGKDRWTWGLFLKTNPDEIIGNVDLWRKGSPENRGFWLGRKFWGQGLMSEATDAITDYAFDHLGFDQLILSNALGNVRSRRVKEKVGAKLIGTRPMQYVDKSYSEAEVWLLEKEAWREYRRGQAQKK